MMFDNAAVRIKALEYFCGDEIAADAWITKYALRNFDGELLESSPDDMHVRMSREFARIEQRYPDPIDESEIYALFKDFKFIIPQGSPMAALGNPYQIQSLSNCFVIPGVHDQSLDSYGGILLADQEQAQIMKRRGGVGFDISGIRPAGTHVANAARTSVGIGPFMERFSNTCREVGQGGRRGALMLTISCESPDIETFVNIKRDLSKVTGANVSVKITDALMKAVRDGGQFTLRWPVGSADPVVSKKIDARYLWDMIIDSAWMSGEPGILFWDVVRRRTPSDAYVESVSTNPCSEIVLPADYDACRLMAMNVASYVIRPYERSAEFDFDLFSHHVKKAVRLMDDLIDLEIESIKRIVKKIDCDKTAAHTRDIELRLWNNIANVANRRRRIGLGLTGFADCLAELSIGYGSDESIEFAEKLYKRLALESMRASVDLARQRGPFPDFDRDKEIGHEFLEQVASLDPDLRDAWLRDGRRNIALTTTAPCGTISLLTRTSSGIEPVYRLQYTRRRKISHDESCAKIGFVDDSGDAWQEYDVLHPGMVAWMKNTGNEDIEKSPYWNATSSQVDIIKSVDLLAVAAKWTEHSISKTFNLPKHSTKRDVAHLYEKAWETGFIKGFTVYVEGSRSGVLIERECNNFGVSRPLTFATNFAPVRSGALDCDVHKAKIDGEDWTIIVGLMDKRPYELFGGLSSLIEIPKKITKGQIFKRLKKSGRSRYDFVSGDGDDRLVVHDIVNVFDNLTNGSFTRTISLALRHGTPVQFVVEQLLKDDRDSCMFSFSRVIARVLKSYIPNGSASKLEKRCPTCGSEGTIMYQEGCMSCTCGFSRCS